MLQGVERCGRMIGVLWQDVRAVEVLDLVLEMELVRVEAQVEALVVRLQLRVV